LEWSSKLIKFVNGIMNKENNIYKEKIQLGAYYTYDKNNKKVYDLKSIRKSFKRLINKLK
tara:strand:- start:38 stop:217 length:180 start_codon:yes stop_codon:yes gene_type:complete